MTLPTSGTPHQQRFTEVVVIHHLHGSNWHCFQDLWTISTPIVHVFRAQNVDWDMGGCNSLTTMTDRGGPKPTHVKAEHDPSVPQRSVRGLDEARVPLGQSGHASVADFTDPVPPWAPHGKVKHPVQAQIIRLLSYAPVFHYGNGEFHDWPVVQNMLSQELQDMLPANMDDFLQDMQAKYPDFAFKMDGSTPAKVAFARQPPVAPGARNYVTERVMAFCRAQGVRQATMKEMIEFADPSGAFHHQPADFIGFIKADCARFQLIHHADPWQVTVALQDHVILAPRPSSRQGWTGSQGDSASRKRRSEDVPVKRVDRKPRTTNFSIHQGVIDVPDDPVPVAMAPASDVNGNQLPMPTLIATQMSMQ
jgi:hypothetical protein